MSHLASLFFFIALVAGHYEVKANEPEVVKVTSETGGEDSCTLYKGYDITPGYDLQLIPYSSSTECCKHCSAKEECVAWTMYEGKCHLKGSTELVKARVPQDTVSGIKSVEGKEGKPTFSDKPAQVQSPNGAEGRPVTCEMHTGFEIAGEELANLGFRMYSECCHACGNTELCKGFTHTGWQCKLMASSKLVGDSENPSIVSGVLLPSNK